MFTPFEELEYLAEYLPEEGESVIVSRRHGELVCEPFVREDVTSRRLLDDPVLTGRLIQANERLRSVSVFPVVASAFVTYLAAVVLAEVVGVGWSGWYWYLGLVGAGLVGTAAWVRRRRCRLFRSLIRPMLTWQLKRHHADAYALLAEVRGQPELRALADELWRWVEE